MRLSSNVKIGKERGNSYQENEEISGWKAHINTRKLNWNTSTTTDAFLDQKRVNLSEHMVKMAPCEEISRWKAHINKRKLHCNVLTITDVFLDQKRVNLCEHMVKMVPCELPRLSEKEVKSPHFGWTFKFTRDLLENFDC